MERGQRGDLRPERPSLRRAPPGRPLVALCFTLAVAADAAAHCRLTTCDAGDDPGPCAVDEQGCASEGTPLAWPTDCLSYGVAADGSALRGITGEQLERAVDAGFAQWLGATCDEGHPAVRIWDMNRWYGPVACAEPGYSEEGPNASIWTFRDVDWPYTGADDALARTTLTFLVPSGRILDADVEINSFAVGLTTTDDPGAVVADLQSIVTHEAGHFLGLAHSPLSTATMNAHYSPGDLTMRSLSEDDEAGVCEIYPPSGGAPSCDQPAPPHGYTRFCPAESPPEGGCAVAAARPRGARSLSAALAVALATGLGRLRRRRPGRP